VSVFDETARSVLLRKGASSKPLEGGHLNKAIPVSVYCWQTSCAVTNSGWMALKGYCLNSKVIQNS
jgi:hypothetical protein